jgi:CHAT domain-containing protein
MMKNLKYILAFCSAMLIFFLGNAQESTESRKAYVRIDSVYTRNDSLFGLLPVGTRSGINNGAEVRTFTSYKTVNGVEHPSREIGYGGITGTSSDLSEFVIILHNKTDKVEGGDYISIMLTLPVQANAGILSEMSLMAIEFTNLSKERFYEARQFIGNGDKAMETKVINTMVDDLHQAYELVKDYTNLPAAFFTELKEGRFKGKTPLITLKDATAAHLESFLLYVKTYPAKYIAKPFRLAETFSGWVMYNSPYSSEEVKRELMPLLNNPSAFAKKIVEFKSSILLEAHVSTFGDEAIKLAEKNKMAESDKLVQLAMAIAMATNDTVGKVSLYLTKGQILQDKEKYKESIVECEKSIAAAKLFKDNRNSNYGEAKRLEVYSMIKKGYCQYSLTQYKEGVATFADAAIALEKVRYVIGRENYNYAVQKVYEYTGWIHYAAGDYTKAISEFQKAIDINDSINTYGSRNKNASFYKQIGKVYKEQGNYRLSLGMYATAHQIYKTLNETRNRLLVEVDVGEAYYYLSEYEKAIEYLSAAKRDLLLRQEYDHAGYSSSLMGSAYYYQGKYDSAIVYHHKSVELRKLGGSVVGPAYSWNQLGELYLVSGNKIKALAAYDSSIFYYNRINDKSGIANNYNSIGKVYQNDENFKKAVENFEKAMGNTSKATVEALYNMGSAWMMLDTVKARNYMLKCKKLSAETGNDQYEFYTLIELAKVSYRNKHFNEADGYYDSVVSKARSFGTGRSEALRLNLKAYSQIQQLELDSAINNYLRSVSIYDTVDASYSVWERVSLAEALISKGEFKQAETVLFEGARVADSLSAKLALGSVYTTQSFLYALLGEFEKGMAATEKASKIYEETGNTFRQASAFMSKGTLYKGVGEFKKSVEAYLQADSIYQAEKTEEMRGTVMNNIGVTYFNQGDFPKAIEYFNLSGKYLKPGVQDENYILNRSNIAECYYYMGRHKESEKIMLSIIQFARDKKADRIGSTISTTLGKIYLDDKQYEKASVYLEESKKLVFKNSEKESMVDVLVQLGKLKSATGKADEAEKNFEEAVQISKEYTVSNQSWIVLYQSGLFYYQQKKFDKAIANFKAAVEIIEKNSNNVYGGEDAKKIYRNDGRKVDLYGKLVVALAESGKTSEAWAYANRSNMTGIKELMGSMVNQTGDPLKDAALEQAKSLSQKTEALAKKEAELKAQPQTEQVRSQLQSIGQEKEIAEKDYIKYSENLLAKFPDLKENFYDNVNPVDFENYKGILPADMAVLLYVINDNKLLIFSLTNEKLGITPLDLKGDITRTIREYAALLKLPGKATGTGAIRVRSTIEDEEDNIDVSKLSFKDVSEKMYQLLISPVAAHIANKKKLCIIPNGDLGNVPFQSLGYKSGADGFRFLIEDMMVFYTSRMKIFDVEPPANANMSSFAVFGVPDQTLKYTEQEAKSIGGIMKISDGVYTDSRATEGQAKESLVQKKYVHFATHGVLNYTDYNASYLKFLPSADTAEGNNGKLTIDEIYGLKIAGCELVTLSACETAVSRQKTKGWKISPANSLLRKRVKTVIATMWKVDDEATSILMNEFYGQLSTGKEKGESLRLAQETLSKNSRYSHPYFWSAFVLYGDWR